MRYFFLFIFLFITSDVFAINPDRDYKLTPDSLGLSYDQITLTTSDDYNLNAWKIYPIEKDRDTTIILAYGDAGNMSYFVYQAAALARQGYTVLLFDYRGFGKSEDFKMNFDYLYYDAFATDLVAALNWAKANIDNQQTGILALSMGTIAATFAFQNEEADFLIGEGFVADPSLIEKRLENNDNPILLPKSHKQYKSALNNLEIPILIFAGTKDQATTLADAKSIVSQRTNRKLVTFEGKHLEGFWKLTDERFGDKYCNKISSFIEKI